MRALCIQRAELDGELVGLRVEQGAIAELGPGAEPRAGDEVIDAAGMLLVPPLVNGHTHAAMTLLRGFGDDLPLMEWLEKRIWPAEAKLEPADVYWATRLAAVEMIRSGTTRFFDMYWHGDEVARAVADAGLRAVVSHVFIDRLDPEAGRKMRDGAVQSLDRLAAAGSTITPGFGPHAIYTVSAETLAWIAGVASEREVPIQIHLSETEREVSDCLSAHGVRPAQYLDRLGMLGPRTVLSHGVWLDDSELELIAERGATIVTNPAANMKLAIGGTFPYPRAARAGVRVGLGTDGVASNSNLDMFEEVKLLALVQKHASRDPAVLPAAEALAVAQGRRSELLGGRPLEPGEPADFLLVRRDDPALSAGDPAADLVYAASGAVVDTTVVAGRVLMRDGFVAAAEEAVAEVRARAARLTA
ncbi:MAG TPA: amidohydrolase [Solirubrobacterales bacterium]|jgi:5-methylthioadenosine/S-adenosylhomocysteine deaminase|nr:amidohydrolase [Solirubrobacterales bacterium]